VTLLAVPNVSEGRDPEVLAAIEAAFARSGGARVLDASADPDHHRAVFTLAGEPGALAAAVADGAQEAIERIDLRAHAGAHPRAGAVDVAPIVFRSTAARGAACAEALVLGDLLGELGVPVHLYGELGGGRSRAQLRRDPAGFAPDFGPGALHPTAGATLVTARAPLIAFNVELAPPATLADARRVAAQIREGGADGLPGVRAIGLTLEHQGLVQVSTNVEDWEAASPAQVVAAVREHAAVSGAELVGLAPAAAWADFPDDVPLRGLRTLEDALGAPG